MGRLPVLGIPCAAGVLSPSAFVPSQGTWTTVGAPPASVPTTYVYTGDAFTIADAPYSVGGSLTGSITVANPLPPFLPLTDLRPALASLSFQNGVDSWTLANANVCQFQVATDGAGNITRWIVSLQEFGPANDVPTMDSTGQPGVVQGNDLVGRIPILGVPCSPAALSPAASSSTQGTWTRLGAPAPSVPTTYNYLGDPFTFAEAPYALGGSITGSITLANPLPPFLPLTDLRPALQALSFQNGVETLSLAITNVCQFEVATDGSGNITSWLVLLEQFGPVTAVPLFQSTGQPGAIQGTDLTGRVPTLGVPCGPAALTPSASTATQGTWSGGGAAAEIPTLGNLGLLAIALSLAGVAVRRLRSSGRSLP